MAALGLVERDRVDTEDRPEISDIINRGLHKWRRIAHNLHGNREKRMRVHQMDRHAARADRLLARPARGRRPACNARRDVQAGAGDRNYREVPVKGGALHGCMREGTDDRLTRCGSFVENNL